MATKKLNREFKEMFPSLDDILEWIGTCALTPADVFDEDVLADWAAENGYVLEDECECEDVEGDDTDDE